MILRAPIPTLVTVWLVAALLVWGLSGCQMTGASASISSDNPSPALGLSLSPKALGKTSPRKNTKRAGPTSKEAAAEVAPRRIQLPRTDPVGKSQTAAEEAAD